MKTKTAILTGIALLAAMVSHAQTNAVNTNVVANPTPIQQLETGVTAGYNELTSLSFTNGLAVGPFGIRHSSDYGGGIFARTANPSGVNVGFAIAGIYEHQMDTKLGKVVTSLNFYDATLNLNLNGTTVIPILNWPVDYVLESGPAANLKNPNTVYEQSLAGIEKTFKLGKQWGITIQVGEGHCSRWSDGFFQEVAGVITYKPHGW